MSVVKRNLAANVIGTGWSGVLTLVMAALYVRLLGTEAYGLVGFHLSLQTIATLLDFGLGVAVNRDVARATASDEGAARAGMVVRTAEVVYWCIAIVVGLALFAAAPLLATRWFHATVLPEGTILTALRLMAFAVALRFPYSVYAAGLFGMQRHVALNSVLTAVSTVRAAGAFLLLLFVARDVRLVFLWEVVMAAALTAGAATALHFTLPKSQSRFDSGVLAASWRFARGAALIGILSAAVTQVDKLAVSLLQPLSVFGHYALAATLAAVVSTAVWPVQATIFPRFSQLVARGDQEELALAYHRSSQTLAAILFSLAAFFIAFGRELVTLWTGDAGLAGETRWLVILLVAAAALNAALAVPYALQLAHGWTALALLLNAAGLVFLVPFTIWGIDRYGAAGAALAPVVLHAVTLLVSIRATHARYLRGHLQRWLLQDTALPAVVAMLVAFGARSMISGGNRFVVLQLLAAAATIFAMTSLATPVAREWVTGILRPRDAV